MVMVTAPEYNPQHQDNQHPLRKSFIKYVFTLLLVVVVAYWLLTAGSRMVAWWLTVILAVPIVTWLITQIIHLISRRDEHAMARPDLINSPQAPGVAADPPSDTGAKPSE